MITEERFLRGLRLVLAFDGRHLVALNANRIALGVVVTDNIERIIIPKLQKELDSERDEGKQEEIVRQIELWEKYADDSTPEGKSWNIEAAKVVAAQAHKFKLPANDAEDLANDIASEFYTNPRLASIFDKFDIDTGPLGLSRAFKKAVGNWALDVLKKESIRSQKTPVSLNAPTTDEGGTIGDVVPDVSISELDRSEFKEHLRGLTRHVFKKLNNDNAELLFSLWLEKAEDVGPDKVNFSRHIYPEWTESTGKSKALMDNHWKKIRELMRDYYQDTYARRASVPQQSKIANVVAVMFWRQRFAAWMLAPYLGRRKLWEGK